jgi:hypothetical protein
MGKKSRQKDERRRLVLLGRVLGERGEEQQWHAEFARYRIGRTEWFRADAELLSEIADILATAPSQQGHKGRAAS